MGGCASKPNKKLKSKAKYLYKSCKFRRKVSPSTPVAPIGRHTEPEVYDYDLSFREFVMVDIQNEKWQDEEWFDSLSVLDSDTDEDFISVDGDGFTLLDSATVSASNCQRTQNESNSCFTDYGCNQQKNDCSETKVFLKNEERVEDDFMHSTKDKQNIDLSCLTKAEETRTKRMKVDLVHFIDKGEENKRERSLTQFLRSENVSDINQPPAFPGSTSKRKKSTVTMVTVKRKLCDGDGPTEFCK